MRSAGPVLLLVLYGSWVSQAQKADGYVGSKACYGCHPAIFKSFETTDMGRSMTAASDWHPLNVPAAAKISQFTVTRSDEGWKQSETEAGVFAVDHTLDYVVGSGANGLSFLIRRGKYLFEAPLSYYSRSGKWDLSPGYEQAALGFNRMVPEECINCHAGRANPMAPVPGAYFEPAFRELAIGCENCHGPGGAHVRSSGKLTASIVNPAKLSAALADNICINCHQGGDARVTQAGKSYQDYQPGEWLFDTAVIVKPKGADPEADLLEHYSAMQASRCFRESGGKMSCLTCHDPHVQPAAALAASSYRPKCLACHSESSCTAPLATRRAQRPSDNCIGCHMPKREITQISHSALTNHRIPAHQGEAIPPTPDLEIDGLRVVDPPGRRPVELSKLVQLKAYKQLLIKYPQYQRQYDGLLEELTSTEPQNTFVQAAIGDKAFSEGRYEDAVGHLKLGLGEETPGLYLELGQSLIKLGRDQEAIECLKTGVGLDPYDAVMQKTLILQYINARSYAEARRLMQQYVATFPEDAFMRELLARVSK
jgi:hypothetical protein